MGRTAQLSQEFEKRNVKSLGLSTDSVDDHHKWIADVNNTQTTNLEFPILADVDQKVAKLYGMIHPEQSGTFAVRSVFIIDPNKKVRLTMTYPMSVGRNFDEILRVIDSLQLTANYQVATPVDWKQGDDCVVVPAIKTEDIPAKFPKGFTEIKPYLRMTPQPDL